MVLEGEVWSRDGLDAVARIERAAAASPGVERTAGLWSRHRWLLPEWPPADLDAFRDRALADPLVRAAGWVSEAGAAATVAVKLEARASAREIDALELRVRKAAAGDFETSLAGLPVFERAMDASQRRVVTLYLPILVGVTSLLLWLGFGSPRAAWPPLALVGAVVGVTLGAFGYSGEPLDMISIIFVPILFVIVLASAIHLQTGLGHQLADGLEVRQAAAATMRRKGRAVIWAALTTGVAFGSFGLSPLAPVRLIGLWLAAGLGWMLVAIFGFYPRLLEQRGRDAPSNEPRGTSPGGSLDRFIRERAPSLARWIIARRLALLVGFAALTLTALAGATRLTSDSNLANYFAAEHPARKALDALEGHGLAGTAAEVLVRLPAEAVLERRFRDPDQLERLASLSEALRTTSVTGPSGTDVSVRGALGAGDLFRAAISDLVVEGPASSRARWLVLGLMQADPDAAARLDEFLGDDGRAARLSVLLPLRGPQELDPLVEAVRKSAVEAFPEARVSIQGELPLLLAAQRHLVRTLSVSLCLTFLCVVAILALVTRSATGTLRAVLPNLWAVAVVFGIMGWAEIPFDSTTVMIAAVVLGLAVDDTLHTLAELGWIGVEPTADRAGRLGAILQRVGSAHLLTSLALIAGFGVCALSESLLLSRFGALSAAGVAAALAGDLLLFPALLAGHDR